MTDAQLSQLVEKLTKENRELRFALQAAWPYVHGHCTINYTRKQITAALLGKAREIYWGFAKMA